MALQTRYTALQNEIVRLYHRFESNGELTNPMGQPSVDIVDSDGITILESLPAQQEHQGIWYVDWYIPKDIPLGTYYDQWRFQWTSETGIDEVTLPIHVSFFDSFINFVSPAISHTISDRVSQLLLDLQNDFIYEATHIPIYWEQAMRVQQEDIQKRKTNFYYLTLDSDNYDIQAGDVYTNNGRRYTVVQVVKPVESSSSSESEENVSSSSSSDNGESSSSSSSSSEAITTTTTTLETYVPQPILTVTGAGNPQPSGVLTLVNGTGSTAIGYESYEAKQSKFTTVYALAYRNWVRDWKPIVRKNQRIVEDGWYVDYDGRIYFDSLLAPEDTIEVSYKWSCYSTEQLLGFLRFGLKMMNTVPPASTTYRTLDMMPMEWDAAVLLYAAVLAMRRAIFALNFQEKAIVYGHYPDYAHAHNAASLFQSLYQDYQKTWDEVSDNVKSKKLPGIAMYVVPEYTLPGGRSRWFRYLFKTGSGS